MYVQTHEYDLEAKTYPTIWTHHKLRNSNANKIPVYKKTYKIYKIPVYKKTYKI